MLAWIVQEKFSAIFHVVIIIINKIIIIVTVISYDTIKSALSFS